MSKPQFYRLSDAIAYLAGAPVHEHGARRELETWMETHQKHLDAGDSFDAIDGTLTSVPSS